jgi:hypothetical protein
MCDVSLSITHLSDISVPDLVFQHRYPRTSLSNLLHSAIVVGNVIKTSAAFLGIWRNFVYIRMDGSGVSFLGLTLRTFYRKYHNGL